MTMLNITDVPGGLYVGTELKGIGKLEIGLDDAWQALTDLARILNVAIIDSEQRKTLEGYLEEVDADENDYDSATEAWGAWQNRCEAIASTIAEILKEEDS